MDDKDKAYADKTCRRSRRVAILLVAAAGSLLGALSLYPRAPSLVWNVSGSVPAGLYRIESAAPGRGDILLIRPKGGLASLLARSGVLSPHHLLLKPLAGLPGETVCRTGQVVTLDDRVVALAHTHASNGARLPAWRGCRQLAPNQYLVLAGNPHSFDGRYFGPIDKDQIIGIARPVMTFAPSPEDA